MVHQPHRKHQLLSTANSKRTACLGVKGVNRSGVKPTTGTRGQDRLLLFVVQ